jgi:hypothetical protein
VPASKTEICSNVRGLVAEVHRGAAAVLLPEEAIADRVP